MRRIRRLFGLLAGLVLVAGALVVPPAMAAPLRPIVFVHGYSGSGSQFETQAKRFASNGYPAEYIESQEYDTTFEQNSAEDVYAALDARIARLKAATGADKVELVGHSLGTYMSQNYLKSSAARAANVAHYVNLDGFPADAPPGGVPTLAIWGQSNDTARIGGATNVYSPNEAHVETTSSVASFRAMYRFFTGDEPDTTNVVAEAGTIRLGGRALSFPSNVGLSGVQLNIYTINPATGARVGGAVASYALSGDGSWGPFQGTGTAYYEFELVRPGGVPVHHLYFQPFRRTDLGIRLLSTDPGTGIDEDVDRSSRSIAMLAYRNKEWWGDQGANSDTLVIGGTSVLNSRTASRDKGAIAFFAFDAYSDRISVPTRTLLRFALTPFITGVDLYKAAATPSTGSVVVESAQRGGNGAVSRLAVPNWPSSGHTITVNFDDYVS
ncbi:lipase [Actinomadura sp. NBRC 104412]|nr:lipase [Actinomadura sp. NBRC 104412]